MKILKCGCKEFCGKVAITFSQCESGFKDVMTILKDKKRKQK